MEYIKKEVVEDCITDIQVAIWNARKSGSPLSDTEIFDMLNQMSARLSELAEESGFDMYFVELEGEFDPYFVPPEFE